MRTSGNGNNPTIRIPDPVGVKELAVALGQKPFKIIADTIALGTFQNIHGHLNFDMASKIAHKYGYSAQKIS
jgi:translation initiation factor IF-2